MPGLIDTFKQKLGIGGRRRAKQLKGLEERSSNPTVAEKVVVRPDRVVKKQKVVNK